MKDILLGQKDLPLHPGLPDLSPLMGDVEIILFIDVKMNFDKFIKMPTIRFTPRTQRTMPSPSIALIPKDPGRTPPSLLDQGQNPENQKDLLHHWLSLNGLEVCNYVLKLDQTNLKLLRIQQLEATESQQVEIPTGVDYRRPSQERDEQETDQDEVIRIPKPMSMDEDWKISVQKAFADRTRTKAPCEIPANEAITLPQTISKREFEAFQKELRARNPKTPLTVIENMASIFAQSGKMNLNQARDSYDFTVPSMKCFGLFTQCSVGTHLTATIQPEK